MNVRNIDWDAHEWKLVRRGVERKGFTGDGVTIALHRIWPGHEVIPHAHPNEQVVFIMEGEAEYQIGNETLHMRAGSVALVPPNVVHCIRVVGDKVVLNLDVFCPSRPEYVT